MIRLLGFLSTFLLISCSSHRHISINPKPTENYFLQGKIDDYDSGIVYLGTYDTTRKGPLIILDSARIFNSYFHFKGLLAASLICKLKIDSKHVWPYSHYFVLDTGTTNVKLFKDSMANSVITANKLTEKYNAFNKKLHDLAISFDSNFSLRDKGIISTDSLNKLEKAFYGKKSELLLQQVKANPGSIVSAFIVKNNLNYEIDLPILENIYNLLTDKNNYYARSILNYLNVLLAKTKTEIGFEAPHFNITDNKNREITNETFKGKYLLIDFWASWCVGCREENPYFVNAYKKFAGKGLEMISISIDVEKQSWEDAIKKDKLSWIQACNLKGPDSNKISRDFGITLIPANFLIDKEGNIVAKDLMGKDIEKELERLLGED